MELSKIFSCVEIQNLSRIINTFFHFILSTIKKEYLTSYQVPHPVNLLRAGGAGGPVTAEVVDIMMMLTLAQFCTLGLS